MEAIGGGLIGFLLGYVICMVLASFENQLMAKREEKFSAVYQQLLDEQQLIINQQNQIIAQLENDKTRLSIRQQQLRARLQDLKRQYERTLSALN